MLNKLRVLLVSMLVAGCGATSKNTFINEASSLKGIDVCFNHVDDLDLVSNYENVDEPYLKIYARKLSDEVSMRGLNLQSCRKAVKNRKSRNSKIVVATALVGAVAYVAYRSYKDCKKKRNCSNSAGHAV